MGFCSPIEIEISDIPNAGELSFTSSKEMLTVADAV